MEIIGKVGNGKKKIAHIGKKMRGNG